MSLHSFDRPTNPSRPPKTAHRAEPSFRPLPLFKLILLSDGVNDIMFVVRTIMELTRLCRAEATHKMWEVHHYGRSVLLVTYKERAELYAEQFTGRGLKVALEPA